MELNNPFWTGKRVCVTGGSGFLGAHLVRQLVEQGARVRVVALPGTTNHPFLQQGQVETVAGDIRDRDLVNRAVADCQVIFHTAGIVGVWGPALHKMRSVNIEGTRTLLEATPPRTRFVHTSSIVTVGASRLGEPLTEENDFYFSDLAVDYVQTKRASENVALEAAQRGRDVVVTNPGSMSGPDDYEPSIIGRLCARFWKGRVPLATPGGINVVDVRDVARGHLLAAEHGRTGCRYILGGENRTVRQFLALLSEVAGMRPRFFCRLPGWLLQLFAGLASARAWFTGKEPYPSFQQLRMNRFYWYVRSDRAARELGYVARPLVASLADTYRWYCSRGLANPRGVSRWWIRPPRGTNRAAA
jgi:dihydroflavonol-4-reductase